MVATKSDEQFVLAAIKHVGDGQLHCGLVLSEAEKASVMVHLAWHCDLQSKPYKGGYLCYETGLDLINQAILVDFALLVAERNGTSVPYGFSFSEMKFDPISGVLGAAPLGKGLTCASFVYALLNSIDLPPLAFAEWPKRAEDEAWRKFILGHLRNVANTQDHIDAIISDDESIRIRPEEIVAAVCEPVGSWPLPWQDVQVPSVTIRQATFKS